MKRRDGRLHANYGDGPLAATWLMGAPKHQTAKAYDRAYTQIVRLRRRFGFPLWETVEEVDAGMRDHSPEEGRWWDYLEKRSRGSTNKLRGAMYVVNQIQGPMNWRHAYTVPRHKQDECEDTPGMKRAPRKKMLKKKKLLKKKGVPGG